MADQQRGPTSTPPNEDAFVWYREDRVLEAMQAALESAIETHGDKAKAFAWDARHNFKLGLSQ